MTNGSPLSAIAIHLLPSPVYKVFHRIKKCSGAVHSEVHHLNDWHNSDRVNGLELCFVIVTQQHQKPVT